MEEIKKHEAGNAHPTEDGQSAFNFQIIYTTLILNWKWFILSIIICLGIAAIYLRYTTPIYMASAKLLIKDEGGRGRTNIRTATNLGIISNSEGLENEMEILKSRSIATQAVRDLKLYTTYRGQGKITDKLIYKTQPITVDIDPASLEKIKSPINLTITKEQKGYHVEGTYYVPIGDTRQEGPYKIDKILTTFPATIGTRAGILSFNINSVSPMTDGSSMDISIISPRVAAGKYVGSLGVTQGSSSSIALLSISDENSQRAVDYLKQLAICYNRQANEDKNEIAVRTEEFINNRLEKINAELGSTESQLENYKKANRMVELQMTAAQAANNSDSYDQRLSEANTQLALLNSINEYMNQPSNKYETLPSNVGLNDQSATTLISRYNDIVLERNRLLKSASETSPTVTPLTAQLDDLTGSIRRAMTQARRNLEIQRNAVASQFGKYNSMMLQTPEQERMLNQIGRQQEVKSGLYLMLLQKREENSISLAATADKGKLIDEPSFAGQIAPKSSSIYGMALAIALAVPSLIFFLIAFFRYKIEGHEDVANLTSLPIIADVAVASDTAKAKADIVVQENKNSQMEEVFRAMRTNIQFMLKEGEKVVAFTSSISGEGKTFTAANLSVSLALLGKKVVLVGLDIRKPRLAELFEIDDHRHGITNLLVKSQVTMEDVHAQTLPSGVNNNLNLLMAGPIPPNPAELLTRETLDQTINLLKEEYDYVILDTAPVGLVTDTLQLGRVSNITVVLCRADYTPKENFELINNLSNEKKLPNMCVVINGIDLSKKKYGYYYGYGKYGKYGKYGRYGHYGKYGNYGSYGSYSNSHYSDKNDTSVKK